MRRSVIWGIVVAMVLCLSLVLFNGQVSAEEKKYVIGVAQPTFNHPIRQAHFWAAEIWKETHPNVEFIFMDGQKNAAKQIADVEDLIARQVDLIIIVEHAHGSTTNTLKKAKARGIPIVCVDRALSDPELADSNILGNDFEMGKICAEYLAEKLGGKGKIVVIQAPEGVIVGEKRREGFYSVVDQYPDMEVITQQVGNWQRSVAYTVMENILQGFKEIDGFYADNDEMALGALKAIKEAGRQDEIIVTGVDGEKAALESIKEGGMAFSAKKVLELPLALDVALAILEGGEYEKTYILKAPGISKENVDEHYNPFALF